MPATVCGIPLVGKAPLRNIVMEEELQASDVGGKAFAV